MRKNKNIKMSAVLSFWNEEEVLDELIDRLRKVMREDLKGQVAEYELIFINDDSTDGSLELLERRRREYGDIKVINMSRNFGVSASVMAGFAHASGDVIVYLDTDLQDPPEVIPEMFDKWLNEEADVVHTKRLSRAGESTIKLMITRLGYYLINLVSNIHFESNVGDFKILDRVVVDQILKLKEQRPFIRGLVNWVGFKQAMITYHRDARGGGETKFPVFSWRVIANFLDSAIISFSDAPLKLALGLGFVFSGASFLYLVVVLVMKFLGYNIPGWTAIMASMLLLGGVQLLTMGVMGLYLNSVFEESKKRPLYIIKEMIGFGGDQTTAQASVQEDSLETASDEAETETTAESKETRVAEAKRRELESPC